MPAAAVHCHVELNDFLSATRRKVAFTCPIVERSSVKDLREALGVAHPEIARLVVHLDLLKRSLVTHGYFVRWLHLPVGDILQGSPLCSLQCMLSLSY